jgi:hypothetical protein
LLGLVFVAIRMTDESRSANFRFFLCFDMTKIKKSKTNETEILKEDSIDRKHAHYQRFFLNKVL